MNHQQLPSTPLLPTPSHPQTVSLSGLGELLKQAFQIYKKRIGVLLVISVIPFFTSLIFVPLLLIPLFFSLPFIAFYKSLGLLLIPLILLIVVLGIIMVIVNLWAGASLLYAIKGRDQEIGIRESFAMAWPKILSYWWISILNGIIVMLGFLLLIVPGIIFSIWFSFSFYVLVSEDRKGMKALLRSKELVKGYWWKVFWRFFMLNIIVFLVAYIVSFIPFIKSIIYLFITPFSVIFGFLIYENLKQLKGEALH